MQMHMTLLSLPLTVCRKMSTLHEKIFGADARHQQLLPPDMYLQVRHPGIQPRQL